MNEPLPVRDRFGVYLHIPFCHHRCDYCAFATWTDRHHMIGDYLSALRTDIARAVDAGMEPADTVFVGGGTPSLVPAEELVAVLAAIPTRPGAEVTVECNPDDVDDTVARTYADGGVSRISMGVQSMAPHVLASLGRTHDPDNVRRAVAAVRAAGIGQCNLDLIYGAAGESVDDWVNTLTEAVALSPDHISAYALTIEAGTPLAAQLDRHPDDDDLADKYIVCDEMLTAHGLDNYEISNWARPGHECRHNVLYWQQGNYVGFGCAAHSHRDGRRWWNVRTPDRYVDTVSRGEPTEASFEQLDDPTRWREGLELALRMRGGVPASALPTDGLEGLVESDGTRTWLTRAGRLLANEVSLRLVC